MTTTLRPLPHRAARRPAAPPAGHVIGPPPDVTPDPGTRSHRVYPALLVAGCVVAAVGVTAAARGVPAAVADADLAGLLRAMAAIKAVLVAAGVGVLAWRLRRPAPTALRAAYLAGAWVAAGAVAAMWWLVALGAVAVVLHAVAAALFVLAWRDRDFIPAPAHAAGGSSRAARRSPRRA